MSQKPFLRTMALMAVEWFLRLFADGRMSLRLALGGRVLLNAVQTQKKKSISMDTLRMICTDDFKNQNGKEKMT
jgi:hypothetical protein